MCGITRSLIAVNFMINPETGIILHHPKKDRRGQRRRRAGYVKHGTNSSGGGYRIICFRRAGGVKIIRAHHLVWFWVHGKWPKKHEIDHINGDRDDNRIANLRLATVGQNRANRVKLRNNTSGYKWVSRSASPPTSKSAWRSEVWHRGHRYLSYHATPEEAYARACAVAHQHHQDFFNPGSN